MSRPPPRGKAQPKAKAFVPFNVFWKPEDLARVRKHAAELGVSANQYIVQAVLERLDRRSPTTTDP